jgi:hypothetical protein
MLGYTSCWKKDYLPQQYTPHSLAARSPKAHSSRTSLRPSLRLASSHARLPSLPRHTTTDHKRQRPPRRGEAWSAKTPPAHPPIHLPTTPPIHRSLPNEHHPHPTVARPRSRLLLPERLEPAANRFLKIGNDRLTGQPPRSLGPYLEPTTLQTGKQADGVPCARALSFSFARFCTEARTDQGPKTQTN